MVNNFSILVASTNGTGSQTANLILLRALFRMGIGVSGKNIFPSNIQGRPTWYYLRLSDQGFVAHRKEAEVLVGFNQETLEKDLSVLSEGGVCLHPAEWTEVPERGDITTYTIPLNQFLREGAPRGQIRDYLANMVYVGAIGQLLGIDLSLIEESLSEKFPDREDLFEKNLAVVRDTYQWSEHNLEKKDPYKVQAVNGSQEKILITGNEAAALGAIFGGITLASWYPITPATSLIDSLNQLLPRLRTDPDSGRATYAVIQAEDELSAIGMVMGAGWAGARAMTATSGPGISLMTEFISLGYFAEIPSVIWDIQRIGPSTGLPTRTSQGDILTAYFLGHGDSMHVLLFPSTVAECFEFGYRAFDLAEQLQTPIFVMSDLDLGMNTWSSEPFTYPDQPMERGKVLSAADVEEIGFSRFLDLDGDGVPYRTLPGNEHPLAAYLGRGTGHNKKGLYSEGAEDWEDNMERLGRKYETARKMVPQPAVEMDDDAEIALIAFGSTLPAVQEARARLANQSVKTSFLRIKALPVGRTVKEFIERHRRVFVIELNRDGQMYKILKMEMPEQAVKMVSLCHIDGMPMTADWILEQLNREGVHE